MRSITSRRILFLVLLLAYIAFDVFFIHRWTSSGRIDTRPAPLQLLPVVGTLLAATYVLFLVAHFSIGRIACEYLFLLPLLTVIGAYMGMLVLLLFHTPLSGPGRETPILYGVLYGFFSVIVAAGLWRRHIRVMPAGKKVD
jgi:hypothetical protein